MNYGAPSGGFGPTLGANRLGQNTARTTYGGGGATTQTTGQGYGGGPDPTLDLFKRLAMQKLQPSARAPQRGSALGRRGMDAPPPQALGQDPVDPTIASGGGDQFNRIPMHWVDAYNRPDELKPNYSAMSIDQLAAFNKINPRGEFSRNDTFGNAGGSM